MTSYFGEFFGTMVLIVLGNGVMANVALRGTKAEGGGWLVVTAGWTFAVIIGVFCAIATGAQNADINPVMTLVKTLMGMYSPAQAAITMVCQLLGAFVGACVVWIHFWPHWAETDDCDLILAAFSTGPAIRHNVANIASEIIGTAMLVVPVFAIYSKNVGILAPGFGPWSVGILIWAIGLSLGGTTGYALNPARDLGPRIAHALLPIQGKGDSDWNYAWIPVLGPMLGGLLGFAIARATELI
ncbi:MIP/aquaporin family protein [Azotosporobacter soli]|uniref:MIP/aquaporin family protein n=1 Tax=Azotosporobacter soli TaxID=3055040 RepID=UPI0031FE8598